MNTLSTVAECPVEVLEFRPIAQKDIALLKKYFQRYPSRSCDFSVGGVMMWVDYFDYHLAEIDGNIIIRGRDPESGKLIFYAPCGPMDIGYFCSLVSDYCAEHDERAIILSAEERDPADHIDIEEGHHECMTDWMEYVYDADKMAGFAGRKMEKKRNHLNFFVNNYSPFEIESIGPSNISELIAFTLAFDTVHDDSELAQYESRQVIEVLKHYGDYPFEGIAVRKDGRVIGFSFGETIGDTFFAHVEKGDIAYRGIYQILASRMTQCATSRHPEVRYVNREEDMGDESLRRSKESYHPSLLIDKKKIEL